MMIENKKLLGWNYMYIPPHTDFLTFLFASKLELVYRYHGRQLLKWIIHGLP